MRGTRTERETWLLFGLAAVLAGIATLEFVLGFVYSPALFAIALPFAAAAYLVWYHASGRLEDRVQQGRAGSYRRADAETGGFGAGPRDSFSGRRGGFGARDARGRTDARGASAGRGARARPGADDRPTPAQAYRTLGLDPGADADAVRTAYRERVKAVHPDREGGDEEEFKRVNEAYERLQERA
ncbi:J domain-containing protein [Halorussus salilacus]|uniref:J domain-containing protein n=1 Tax=Halorussus salilacus TaxID=2953750 RepID=UPI00209E5396|nr:J domain-containing protein [Halorussus salilacus]USZ67572.1 J domain-containing protein [Halorussus salilacus]